LQALIKVFIRNNDPIIIGSQPTGNN